LVFEVSSMSLGQTTGVIQSSEEHRKGFKQILKYANFQPKGAGYTPPDIEENIYTVYLGS